MQSVFKNVYYDLKNERFNCKYKIVRSVRLCTRSRIYGMYDIVRENKVAHFAPKHETNIITKIYKYNTIFNKNRHTIYTLRLLKIDHKITLTCFVVKII